MVKVMTMRIESVVEENGSSYVIGVLIKDKNGNKGLLWVKSDDICPMGLTDDFCI